MRWIVLKIVLLTTVLTVGILPQTVFAQTSEKRNQLEELFIWKMSDELKLSPVEEKKFTEIVKGLNKRKADLNHSLLESVEKMSKAANTKKREEELTHYRKTLQSYNHVSEEEFDKLKPLLGADRFVQYVQIKQDLTNRIKSMLANPDAPPVKSDKKTLPTPKVIEEK
ncbi:hypothetical protein [Bdellovibrio svalbardensis]|uniref:Periplasmic heavy metal sensor n=1 Tax=Bdellovibrio svalbardensis TaxID=2972972 RepID=A0ABT6DIX6_9BACT|nr:hypothetical protein [Bdellovibrio svalbardensis]MDG0816818.1 hypothetical protein [Bdellovibrio svalbardensis]